jgi:hypothetical protein
LNLDAASDYPIHLYDDYDSDNGNNKTDKGEILEVLRGREGRSGMSTNGLPSTPLVSSSGMGRTG